MTASRTSASTRCCVVGGGPAGMMLGYLLARAGVQTTVLEKHADFLRDFRGDTVHPSTMRVLDDLGLLDAFLRRPHQKLHTVDGWFGDQHIRLGDFGGLPERYAFIAMMPQWEFLNFLADEARKLPAFTLRMQSQVDGLLTDASGRVRGVQGHRHDGDLAVEDPGLFEITAGCTIACDGRHSTVRAAAGLPLEEVGAPIDVLWFRITRDPSMTDTSLARIVPGRFLVTIDRGDYWQCAFVIPKGGAQALQAQGIAVFRQQVSEAGPFLKPRLGDLRSWDDVKLLAVTINRLLKWSRPGLLCIGDAAHAMSPVGGVGINLAIQDAVATANLLTDKLLATGTVADQDLDAVRRRRVWPTKATQAVQVAIQQNVLVPAIAGTGELHMPLPLRVVSATPALQRVFARLLGMGVRPERVQATAN